MSLRSYRSLGVCNVSFFSCDITASATAEGVRGLARTPSASLILVPCLQSFCFFCAGTSCVRPSYFKMGKDALEAMPSFKLNTGASIPAIGLGTWQSEPGLVGQAVKEAIKVCTISSARHLFHKHKIRCGNQVLYICYWFSRIFVIIFLVKMLLMPSHLIVQVGYRHIDCAKAYGNEKEVIFVSILFSSVL